MGFSGRARLFAEFEFGPVIVVVVAAAATPFLFVVEPPSDSECDRFNSSYKKVKRILKH